MPGTLTVTVFGRSASLIERGSPIVSTRPLAAVDSFEAIGEARPGELALIRGRDFPELLFSPPAARFGSAETSDCNHTQELTLVCRIPVAVGTVPVVVRSRSGMWSPAAGVLFTVLPPEIHRVASAWGSAPGWHEALLPSLPEHPAPRLLFTGVGLASPPVSAVRFGASVLCAAVSVLNDSAVECVGLSNGQGRDARPLHGFLRVELPWPGLSAWTPQAAGILAMPPPTLNQVVPQDVTPGGWVVVAGENIPTDTSAIASFTIGGAPCRSEPIISTKSVLCRLPEHSGLGSLPDRDGDALHVRMNLASGYQASLLGGVTLLGSVALTWHHNLLSQVVAMPSSDSTVFALGDAATAIAIAGNGAVMCWLSVEPEAAVRGVSRRTPTANASFLSFASAGVTGALGLNTTLSASCETVTGATATLPNPRQVAIPSVRAAFESESVAWLASASSSTDARRLPALNATLELNPTPPSDDLARVAASFECEAILTDGFSLVSERGIVTSSNAVPSALAVRFAPLSTTGFPLGAALRLDAWCEWVPTGERVSLPSSDVQLTSASLLLSESGSGRDADDTPLLLSGVATHIRVEVSAPVSAAPVCSLALAGDSANALASMAAVSADVALTQAGAASLAAGATGTGEVRVSATCQLWGGDRSVRSEQSLRFRIATLRTVLDLGAGPLPLALSSGASAFSLRGFPTASLTAAEAPEWDGAQSDGTSCAVEALGELPAGWTQAGTKTRFFADASTGGRVPLDAMALVGTIAFPEAARDVEFAVTCEHPFAGEASPGRLSVVVLGATARWADGISRPAQVAAAAAWPPVVVVVDVSGGAASSAAELAPATRCRASVANASRVEGSDALGMARPDGTVEATLDALSVIGRRGGSFELRVECFVGELPLSPVLRHRFSVQGCPLGQQPRAGSVDLCEVCGADKYSDGGAAAVCAGCPAVGAQCASGVLTLLRGYYRPPRDAGLPIGPSTELHPCFNEEACTLNATAREYGCAEGYSGPLCGVCSDGWAPFGQACGRCWGGASNDAVVAALALAVVAGTLFMARKTVGSTKERRSDRSIAVRQLLSHVQGLGALTLFRSKGTAAFQAVAGLTQGVSASPMSWGPVRCALGLDFVRRFWATAALPVVVTALTALVAVAMELARRKPDEADEVREEASVARALVSASATGTRPTIVLSPLSSTGVRLAAGMDVGKHGHAVSTANPMAGLQARKGASTSPFATKLPPAQSLNKPSKGPSSWSVRLSRASQFFTQHRYVLTLAIVLFLTYMSLVNLAVNALECHDRPVGGVSYLEADLSVECFAGRHLSVVGGAVALLLFVGAGLPLSIFVALRGAVDRPSLRFMSDGYRPGLRWWEALVLLRKMGLVMAASLVTDAPSQVAAAIFVLVPSLVLHVHHKPFEQRRFNVLETLSLSAMIATATLSLVFLRARGGEQAVLEGREQEVDPALDGIVTGLLVGANGLVMVLQVLVVCRAGEGSGPVSAALSRCMSRARMETSRPVVTGTWGTLPSLAGKPQKVSSSIGSSTLADGASASSTSRRDREVAAFVPTRARVKRAKSVLNRGE
ncbi:hypothetical protein FNF29_06013 [Cafeteria roenbergensis]|uniref:IPT/TIG domain-containing protein n=1 Tax=Cafeteria roenbergensis TaxID=33653 RepID=A0A5A8C906_CAFRO|nr:hypothetical protein FNF29_06013 [Cafeteria roenbergensis]|eukprot:KAA0149308.1 hypothetical protein FNF29_06013 [Cafeteria roenbergensis]